MQMQFCMIVFLLLSDSGPGELQGKHNAARDSSASASQCNTSIICPGEELVYEVSWLKIHLGQIRLKTFDSRVRDGSIEHHAAGYIDSYDGIPFVDLHTIDHTQMDSMFYSRGFSALEKKKEQWVTEKSHFDRLHRTLIIEKSSQKDKTSPRRCFRLDRVKRMRDVQPSVCGGTPWPSL